MGERRWRFVKLLNKSKESRAKGFDKRSRSDLAHMHVQVLAALSLSGNSDSSFLDVMIFPTTVLCNLTIPAILGNAMLSAESRILSDVFIGEQVIRYSGTG